MSLFKVAVATGSAISGGGGDAALVEECFTRFGSGSIGCSRVKMASSFWKGVVGVGLFALHTQLFPRRSVSIVDPGAGGNVSC